MHEQHFVFPGSSQLSAAAQQRYRSVDVAPMHGRAGVHEADGSGAHRHAICDVLL